MEAGRLTRACYGHPGENCSSYWLAAAQGWEVVEFWIHGWPSNSPSFYCMGLLLICTFFSINIVPGFSFCTSLSVGESWCLITACGIKRLRVWVLILSRLFQFPALGWATNQSLVFEAEIVCGFLTVREVSAPNPCIAQRSTVFCKGQPKELPARLDIV